MSPLFNMLSRLVIAFLPRSKCLFFFLLLFFLFVVEQVSFNLVAAVTICSDFGPKKIKSVTVSIVPPSICHEVMGPDAMIFSFLNVEF